MCAGPVLLEFFGKAFGDEVDGKAAGVGGDDGAGFAERGDAREEIAFDFEIFGDDFDDPIGFGDAREVVFEIADGNFFGERGSEEGGGAGFFCGVEAGAGDFVAVGGRSAGMEAGWNDIEEDAGEAGVGEMSGDARAHGAGAENDSFLNRTSHRGPFCGEYAKGQVTKPASGGQTRGREESGSAGSSTSCVMIEEIQTERLARGRRDGFKMVLGLWKEP